jgi:flagellar biosynthesis protein FlhF
MHIKQFTGYSIKDVTERMKEELGPDALILNSRKIDHGGVLNSMGRELYEITAAVDTEPQMQHDESAHGQSVYGDSVRSTVRVSRSGAGLQAPANDGFAPALKEDLEQFRSEVDALRSSLKEVAGQLKPVKEPPVDHAVMELHNLLIENDVDPKIAAALLEGLQTTPQKRSSRTSKGLKEQVHAAVARRIKVAPAMGQKRRSRRIVALVGPTGVGKTTTIAKLASLQKLVHHAEVALISADTYRIGAVEQLSTFAQITDVPFEVASKPADLQLLLRKFERCDVVYIDTVGRSQRMEKEIEELRWMIDTADPDEVHLVISTTSSRRTMVDIVDRFAALQPNRLVFSKLDEAATMGGILSVLDRHRLQISYVTTGQTVPYDILEADAMQLAAMVLGGGLARA